MSFYIRGYIPEITYGLLSAYPGGNYNTSVEMQGVDAQSEFQDEALGFHSGLGVEFNISKNIWFFVEGAARYVKFKNLDGSMTISDLDQTSIGSIFGTLWYFRYPLDDFGIIDGSVPLLYIDEEQPVDGLLDVRKAVFDLTGFSLRMGILIRL